MKNTIAILSLIGLFAVSQNTFAQSVVFSTQMRALTGDETGAGVTPVDATVYEFFATTSHDIVSIDFVDLTPISSSLYNETTFSNNTSAPNPALAPTFPETIPDSFVTTPGTTSIALGVDATAFDQANQSWFDASNDGAQTDFRFAQLTTNQSGTFAGRLNINFNGEVQNFPFSFDLGSDPNTPNEAPEVTNQFVNDPPGIKVYDQTTPTLDPNGGIQNYQILATDDNDDPANLLYEITSIEGNENIFGDPLAGTFDPNAFSIATGGLFSLDPSLVSPWGNYFVNFNVTDSGGLSTPGVLRVNVPEPSTIILAGLGLVGFYTRRRK